MGYLFRWGQKDVLEWLLSNPDGPDDPKDQEQDLLTALQNARNPKQAAAFVLNAIYSRARAVLPALQPAARPMT